jgi:predicted transcriptional regulator
MRVVRISADVVPVSDLEAQAAEAPCQASFITAVNEGLADADAGRLRDHDEVVAHLRTRNGATRPRQG